MYVIGCSSGDTGDAVNTAEVDVSPKPLSLTRFNALNAVALGIEPLEFIAVQVFINLDVLDKNIFSPGISTSACADSGSKMFEFQDADLSADISNGDTMIITDLACRFDNSGREGRLQIDYTAGTSSLTQRYVGTIIFDQLILSSITSDFVLNGGFNFDITFNAAPASDLLLTMVNSNKPSIGLFNSGSTTSLETTILGVHHLSRVVDSDGAAMVMLDVDVTSQLLSGSYRFRTESDLTMNAGEYLNSGSLLFTAIDDSALRVTGDSPFTGLVNIVADENGNGTFETIVSGSPQWDDLVSGFLVFLP